MASCKSQVEFNFGQSTDLDTSVYGAARPGAKSQRCFNPDDKVTADEVKEWATFMKANGVTRVVGLLTQSELGTYEQLPVEVCRNEGMQAVNVDLEGTDPAEAMNAVQQQLKEAEAAGEKVVVHCWGGGGRTGKVLAAWAALRHGLTPEEAADKVCSKAKELGTSRRADAAAVAPLLNAQHP